MGGPSISPLAVLRSGLLPPRPSGPEHGGLTGEGEWVGMGNADLSFLNKS